MSYNKFIDLVNVIGPLRQKEDFYFVSGARRLKIAPEATLKICVILSTRPLARIQANLNSCHKTHWHFP